MRGEYLTIEYVLFFAFGVTITVAVFMTFSSISDTIHDASLVEQLKRTGEAIRGAAVNVAETAKATGSNITYNVSIPQRLSACTYAIFTSGRDLNLNCTDNYKLGAVLDLYGLPIQSKGVVYSSRGYIEIKANSTNVILS
ncbi:MAG: hypothetical protein QW751_00785 [Candidatus Aenigmatarchaeota archaeon]|nr:hypothetical protein [Candidatus Aenigmarchaeota archaeon]